MPFLKQAYFTRQNCIAVLFCLLCNMVFSQNTTLDSLFLVLKNTQADTAQLSLLMKISEETPLGDSTLKCLNIALKLADKLLPESRYKSPASQKVILTNKALLLHNIGYETEMWGDIQKAISLFEQSLKIDEAIGNKLNAANTYKSLAFVYSTQREYKKAIELYLQNLRYFIATKDKRNIAHTYNSLGVMNRQLGNVDEAFKYWDLSLEIKQEIGDKIEIGLTHYNMAMTYTDKNDPDKALEHYFKSLDMHRQVNDVDGVAIAFSGISDVYREQKKYIKALLYIDSALTLSKKFGMPSNIKATEKVAYDVYAATGDYEKAFEHYKEYIKYKDSLTNIKTRKASIKNQLKFEYEKKEAVIKEQQEKERAVAEEKDRFQKIVILSVMVGLLLVLVFAVFIFRSLKVTRHQKHIIEEKQKEILDSIRYAKRIQRSLLPTEKYLNKFLGGNNKTS